MGAIILTCALALLVAGCFYGVSLENRQAEKRRKESLEEVTEKIKAAKPLIGNYILNLTSGRSITINAQFEATMYCWDDNWCFVSAERVKNNFENALSRGSGCHVYKGETIRFEHVESYTILP